MQRSTFLVDLDATAVAQPALDCAATVARATGARLRLVHVIGPEPGLDPRFGMEVTHELVERRRDQLVALAFRAADVVTQLDVLVGPPAEVLIRDVDRYGHELVVRSHARDLAARHVSAGARVDVDLFRRCSCSVWTVGHAALPAHPRIAAAVDVDVDETASSLSPLDAAVLDMAASWSRALNGHLSLVHAWRPFSDGRVAMHAPADEYAMYAREAAKGAEDALRALVTAASPDPATAAPALDLRRGEPLDVIPAHVVSQGVDLLVVGASRGSGLGWRGRTAERLLNRVTCSVLAVRPAAAMQGAVLKQAVSR